MRKHGAATIALLMLVAVPRAVQAGDQDVEIQQQADESASPADAEHLRAAQALSAVTTGAAMKQTTDQLTAAEWPQIQAVFLKDGLDQAIIDEIHVDYAAALSKYLLELSVTLGPKIWMQHFTTEELQKLTAFMSSPLGSKYLAETPGILADTMKMALSEQSELETQLNAILKKILTDHGYCSTHADECAKFK